MKITVIGGGPGGLYFAILTKKANPEATIQVFERNKADDSFGFGVVFSDETLSEFLTRDQKSYELIRNEFAYWDNLDVARDGEKVRVKGNGFCGCSRKTLLGLLQQRCREENVELFFESDVSDLAPFADSDYIIAADGINSQIRNALPREFGTKIELQQNKFVWMGSTKPLDAFTYFFRTTPFGTFVAHTYQYHKGMSTWIFECAPETWEKAGFSTENESDTIHKLQQIFATELAGHPLISNRSYWREFPNITNEKWHHENIVLLGDAKATAHYSIGSGTKLAMECAIALSDAISKFQSNRTEAFNYYEKTRRNRVEMIQYAANVSLDWFENMDRHIQHRFMQFAFGVMTRSKKVTYENLTLRDASFTQKVVAEFSESQHIEMTSPAFSPFKLRELTLSNRIVMSAMGQYSANDGLVNNWHLVHYGSRATSGIGLIITEMTAVSELGRITLDCAGIWSENQVIEWNKITSFIHENSASKIGIQIGHSGRKGAVNSPLNGGQPLANGWSLLSASALPYGCQSQRPFEVSTEDMEQLTDEFVHATINSDRAGFDLIELQAHHGFLLASFLSPLTNQRTDEFGGSVENRLKFPLRVFTAMRTVFPSHKPMSVRISASDWHLNGITPEDVLQIAAAFKQAGADIINVSTGNTVSDENPIKGRMWQTPFSEMIRNSLHIPTITSGNIQNIDQINTILLNGRADLVALGKPLLLDSSFVRSAQAHENHRPTDIPYQYIKGIEHLYPLQQSSRKEFDTLKKAAKPDSHKTK